MPNHKRLTYLIYAVTLTSQLYFSTTLAVNTPIICENPIHGETPFNGNNALCLLGCGEGVPQATGSLLPGSVNVTETPYCQLQCVRKNATPAQSSAAPGCSRRCSELNSETPQQLGWCMYWCVDGGSVEQLVVSTTCVPSLQWTPETTTIISGSASTTETYQGFTVPPAWVSWYRTQTIIPHTQTLIFASTSTSSSTATQTGDSTASNTHKITSSPTRAQLFTTTSSTTPGNSPKGSQTNFEASTSTPNSGASGARMENHILMLINILRDLYLIFT